MGSFNKLTIRACCGRVGVGALDSDTLVVERVLILAVGASLAFGWTSPVGTATLVVQGSNTSCGNRGVRDGVGGVESRHCVGWASSRRMKNVEGEFLKSFKLVEMSVKKQSMLVW